MPFDKMSSKVFEIFWSQEGFFKFKGFKDCIIQVIAAQKVQVKMNI